MIQELHNVESAKYEYSRRITVVYPESGRPQRLCVFLDAEHYLERMNAVEVLEELIDEGAVPPMAAVFVSHVDEANRHNDFTCGDQYADFIAEAVVETVRDLLPSLSKSGHVLCGLSLSGLAAMYIRIKYPDRFSAVMSQSGSFWWNDECLAGHLSHVVDGRFYLSVGDRETQSGLVHAPSGMRQEVSQLEANERFAKALGERPVTLRFEIFQGGHDIEPWKQELKEALRWTLEA